MNSIKIAITGGPSGGKTTLIDSLQRDLNDHVAIVPEAASILYRGGFPRKKSINRQKHAQKAIYYTQKELEGLVSDENQNRLIICDRGSLDALAYWPEDGSSFFQAIGSDENHELNRYHFVLHLDTAPKSHYDVDNPIRTESFEEAQILNEKTKTAWKNHPQRIIISEKKDFLNKMVICVKIIQAILDKNDFSIIQKIAGQYESL